MVFLAKDFDKYEPDNPFLFKFGTVGPRHISSGPIRGGHQNFSGQSERYNNERTRLQLPRSINSHVVSIENDKRQFKINLQ